VSQTAAGRSASQCPADVFEAVPHSRCEARAEQVSERSAGMSAAGRKQTLTLLSNPAWDGLPEPGAVRLNWRASHQSRQLTILCKTELAACCQARSKFAFRPLLVGARKKVWGRERPCGAIGPRSI
jgi:hypothetical protein